MSTNEKQFDDDIRKKLSTYRENPSAGLWEQLEKKSGVDAWYNFFFRLNGFLFTDLLMLAALGLVIGFTTTKSQDSQLITAIHDSTKTEILKTTEQSAITSADPVKSTNVNTTVENSNTEITTSLNATSVKRNESTHEKIIRNFYVSPVLHGSSTVEINLNEKEEQTTSTNNEAKTTEVKVRTSPETEALVKAIEQQTKEYFDYLDKHPQKETADEAEYNEPVDIEIMVSPLLNLNEFESAQSSLNLRREKGKFFNNNSFSIRVRGSITPHVFFKTGFMFTQTEDRLFVHREEDKTMEQIDSIQGFILFPFEPPIPHTVYDTSFVHQHLVNDFQSSLHVQRVDIPMLIGYEFNAGKLRMEINAGILFNLSLRASGDLPGDQFNEEVTAGKSENSGLRKQSTTSIYAGFGIAYTAGKQSEIFIEPFYIQSTNTITVKNAAFKASMNYAGFNIGYRIRFEKK